MNGVCGVCGIIHFDEAPIDARVLERMCARLNHRGPDDRGVEILDSGFGTHIGLGHTRLAVIDPSARGHQPMASDNGKVWITYNGEVYNFREIRQQVLANRRRFRSSTDTETLLRLYEEKGEDLFEWLRGMFAFALLDLGQGKLLLARDRLGIKPLYWWRHGACLAFASEIKALIEHPLLSREIDPKAVAAYLGHGYVPAPLAIFKGVRKLPPGHMLVVDIRSGDSTERAYWDPATDARTQAAYERNLTNPRPLDEYVAELRALLEESVRLRLISDVPLGAFLSGGLDSSAIVAVMSKVSTTAVRTFSVGFEEEPFSELPYASIVARKFETAHTARVMRPKTRPSLPRLMCQFDEPFGDSSAIPTAYLSELAREEVTVALSGDGGDELFGGYDSYAREAKASSFDYLPRSIRKTTARLVSSLLPRDGLAFKVAKVLPLRPGERWAKREWDRPRRTISVLRKPRLESRSSARKPRSSSC